MTLYEFILLDKKEQATAIVEKAVYVSERIDGDYNYKLLKLDRFYVEEQWHIKFNERRGYTCIISPAK